VGLRGRQARFAKKGEIKFEGQYVVKDWIFIDCGKTSTSSFQLQLLQAIYRLENRPFKENGREITYANSSATSLLFEQMGTCRLPFDLRTS